MNQKKKHHEISARKKEASYFQEVRDLVPPDLVVWSPEVLRLKYHESYCRAVQKSPTS